MPFGTAGVIYKSFRSAGETNTPTYIDSTNAFTIYWDTGAGSSTNIPNTFPNGYSAFYLMKTEISQRQYCDFLNTLSVYQQGNRHDAALNFSSFHNSIKKTSTRPAFFGCDANNNAGPPTAVTNVANLNQTNDGEWVACNYITWMDGAAYAGWAALRPMTELEFEKACRGPLPAVETEFAWGDAVLEAATTLVSNQYTAAEAPNQGNCNYVACSSGGSYRCGSYADSTSTRAQAGAGYYGALDLSGNLFEWMVLVVDSTFTGSPGDGSLSANGYANVTNWPGFSNGEVVALGNSGQRGGQYAVNIGDLYMALREMDAWNTTIKYRQGWRAARSAP